jgi:hypothetical protein
MQSVFYASAKQLAGEELVRTRRVERTLRGLLAGA